MNMAFIFNNPEIDAEYLNSLYDGDRELLISVFEEYSDALPATVEHLAADFQKNDPVLFKQTVHGYKGSFGYTGFSNISQSMQYIENKVAYLDDLEEIRAEFELVLQQVKHSGKIIQEELAQLKKAQNGAE